MNNLNGNMIEFTPQSHDSVLVFQMERPTKLMSSVYINGVKKSLESMVPPGRQILLIGSDVNIYEITGADATILRLKGLV